MHKRPASDKELGTWLNRHNIMAHIRRLHECQHGHSRCSTHPGGPCSAELIDEFFALARDRALEMASCGAPRAEVWATINREYPALGPERLEMILDEAFSLSTAD